MMEFKYKYKVNLVLVFTIYVFGIFHLRIIENVYSQTLVGSYLGTHNLERIGYFLSDLGDVNNDGFDDFAIASFHSRQDTGSVWLILGKAQGFAFDVSVNYADARFRGNYYGNHVGTAVGSRGNVNGDEYDDILIGASCGQAGNETGHAYLVLGKSSVDWGNNFILENGADASFDGENVADQAGLCVDFIGDLNGDGYDEFLIGAPFYDGVGDNSGKTYLFKGKPSEWQRGISLADADAIFWGDIEGGKAGYSVKRAGDVNGDHIPDFAIGALGIGKVYLFFGRSSINWGNNFNLSDADVIFSEEDPCLGQVGYRIAAAGDVNGDEYDDLLISDNSYGVISPDFCIVEFRGKVYLIFGKASGWNDMNLSQSDVTYIGEANGDQAGYFMNGNFDFNNDGLSDFLIGALYNDQSGMDAGKAYLIKGKTGGWQSAVNLNQITDTFYGERERSNFGFSVSGAGDVNNDGADDFVISAPWWGIWDGDDAIYIPGKVYLYLGESTTRIIEGFVYHNATVPVADVILSVNGSPTTQTDASAHYLLNVVPQQDITVTPSKPLGEDIGETTVTSFDAALVARYVVGLESLSADQQMVADLDTNGNITMYDAVQIARYSAGMSTGTGVYAGGWIFSPQNCFYPNIEQNYADQNFEAKIMGDVDGSWEPVLPKVSDIEGLSGIWDKSFSVDSNTLVINFSIGSDLSLLAYDLVLEYDETEFDFLKIQKGVIGESFQVFSSLCGEKLRIGGFCVEPVNDQGQFISIKFRIKNNTPNDGQIVLKRLQLNQKIASRNEFLVDGVNKDHIEPIFVVDFNYPNPFNNSTTVNFEVPYDGIIRIVIFNEKGSIVRNLLNEPLAAGHHSVKWKGINDDGMSVASGLYLMTIVYGDMKKSLKVLLLK